MGFSRIQTARKPVGSGSLARSTAEHSPSIGQLKASPYVNASVLPTLADSPEQGSLLNGRPTSTMSTNSDEFFDTQTASIEKDAEETFNTENNSIDVTNPEVIDRSPKKSPSQTGGRTPSPVQTQPLFANSPRSPRPPQPHHDLESSLDWPDLQRSGTVVSTTTTDILAPTPTPFTERPTARTSSRGHEGWFGNSYHDQSQYTSSYGHTNMPQYTQYDYNLGDQSQQQPHALTAEESAYYQQYQYYQQHAGPDVQASSFYQYPMYDHEHANYQGYPLHQPSYPTDDSSTSLNPHSSNDSIQYSAAASSKPSLTSSLQNTTPSVASSSTAPAVHSARSFGSRPATSQISMPVPETAPSGGSIYDPRANRQPSLNSFRKPALHMSTQAARLANNEVSPHSSVVAVDTPTSNTGMSNLGVMDSPISVNGSVRSNAQTSDSSAYGNSSSSGLAAQANRPRSFDSQSTNHQASQSPAVEKPPSQKDALLGIGVGSAYVQRLRVDAGETYISRQPASLPIGLKRTAKSAKVNVKPEFLRRAMDIRYTHLPQRMLETEVDDDDDDENDENGVDDGADPHSSLAQREHSLDSTNIAARAGALNYADSPRGSVVTSHRSNSPVDSIIEQTGKIKLFVANPDDD